VATKPNVNRNFTDGFDYISISNRLLQKYFFRFDDGKMPVISRYLATVLLAISMFLAFSSFTISQSL
jgi:hypothetical protein